MTKQYLVLLVVSPSELYVCKEIDQITHTMMDSSRSWDTVADNDKGDHFLQEVISLQQSQVLNLLKLREINQDY